MRKRIIKGNKYGKLTAVEYVGGGSWNCLCECGKYKKAKGGHLNRGYISHCGCLNLKILDLSGKRFGKLVAVDIVSKSRSGNMRWRCQCDCGKVVDCLSTHLVSGNSNSCGCDRPFGKNHKLWNGYEEISGQFWNGIKRGADGSKKRRKIVFNISINDAWDVFIKQERRCVLTGLLLHFPKRTTDRTGTASLDRIDSSNGYVVGNIQWVHKDINRMKNSFNQEYFIQMCRLVSGTGNSCELVDLASKK